MNAETAQRLLDYRKANGYSQEELAEKIAVSRQAISKWERAESIPDMDNLIALSKLYGITIDELLVGSGKPKNAASIEYSFHETAGNAINDHAAEEELFYFEEAKTKRSGKSSSEQYGAYNDITEDPAGNKTPQKNPYIYVLLPIMILAILIIYFILGFAFPHGWAVGWILFLLIPIIETALIAFRTKNPMHFAYPVLPLAIFLFIGMIFNIWHPTWMIFLTVPIYYLTCEAFRRSKML